MRKIVSGTNFGHYKVVFSPLYLRKSVFSQNPIMVWFLNFGFLKYPVTSIQKSKVPPQAIYFFLTRLPGPRERPLVWCRPANWLTFCVFVFLLFCQTGQVYINLINCGKGHKFLRLVDGWCLQNGWKFQREGGRGGSFSIQKFMSAAAWECQFWTNYKRT